MPTTVNGYYDGTQVVVDESERGYLNTGDRLLINIIRNTGSPVTEDLAARRIHMIESEEFVIPTGRSTREIDSGIRELRDNDRI